MSVSITLIYVHPPSEPDQLELASRFVTSYHYFPPAYPHETVISINGGKVTPMIECLFGSIPGVKFFERSDDGWDNGAFIEIAKQTKTDAVFCMGGPGYVRRQGWLQRMAYAWDKHGPGMYGSLASFEIRPHICTCGFLAPAKAMAEYPYPHYTKAERYAFEHGPNSFCRLVLRRGMRVMLVTWDGEYEWKDWRKPRNVYAKGDQSNCLSYFRHSDSYENSDPNEKKRRTMIADRLTEPYFR